jgi:translation initiation factor IF-3
LLPRYSYVKIRNRHFDIYVRRKSAIGKYYRLNQNIPNVQLRVVNSDGSNLGVISRDEALEKAKEQSLDLVEIAPQAKPPVAKIVDFQKFRYEENKKEQAAKKHAKEVELKELWLSPRMAENDLNTRLRRAEQFLQDGDRIMFRVKFKGREFLNKKAGFDLLEKIFASLGDKMSVERAPKDEGRSITTIIGRNKGTTAKAEEPNTNNQVTNV